MSAQVPHVQWAAEEGIEHMGTSDSAAPAPLAPLAPREPTPSLTALSSTTPGGSESSREAENVRATGDADIRKTAPGEV